MKNLLVLFLITIVTSCSSMHLKLNSDYESPKGKGNFTFEKSYDLASFPWICGGTAIFFGGGCWAYFMMPMVPQEQKFIEDAKKTLMKKLNTDSVSLIDPEVVRESWFDSETKLELTQ